MHAVDREERHRAGLLVVGGGGVEQRAPRRDRAVSYTGDSAARPAAPGPGRARAAWANGWKIVCRQAGAAGLGPDRRDHVDQLGLAGDADPVGVAEQRDEQAADDDGVDDVVGVLDQRPGLGPVEAESSAVRSAPGTRRSTRRTPDLEPAPRLRSRAPTWSAVATTASMDRSMSTPLARKSLDGRRRAARSRRAARRSRRRRSSPASTVASHAAKVGILVLELPQATSSTVGVDQAHRLAASAASRPYSRGGLVADLPRPVELVAQAPDLDVVRLLRAVGPAQVGQLGALRGGCSTRGGRRRPPPPGCRG